MTKITVKILGLLFSAGMGVVIATVLVTPFVWYSNATATDGPYFPPPLVALLMVALPLAVLLFPLQALVTVWELLRRRSIGRAWPAIAAAGGLLAGLLWFLAIRSSQSSALGAAAILGVALLQSFVAFRGYILVGEAVPHFISKIKKQRNI